MPTCKFILPDQILNKDKKIESIFRYELRQIDPSLECQKLNVANFFCLGVFIEIVINIYNPSNRFFKICIDTELEILEAS